MSAQSVPMWTLPDRLRKAREHAGLEQVELAEAIGVSRNTVINYERGRIANPRKHVLMAWAMRTGVPYSWLRDGVMPPASDLSPQPDSNRQPTGSEVPQVPTSTGARGSRYSDMEKAA